MRGKANKPGTLQTAQFLSEKDYPPAGECITRTMTVEEREKYQPVKKKSERLSYANISYQRN